MATVALEINTDLLEELQHRVNVLADSLEGKGQEMDPDEVRSRSADLIDAAEEWRGYINARFDR